MPKFLKIYEHPWSLTYINPIHIVRFKPIKVGGDKSIPAVRLMFINDIAIEMVGDIVFVLMYFSGEMSFEEYESYVQGFQTLRATPKIHIEFMD